MTYRTEATSVEGFVQQIACSYLRHGYWWYVTGRVPPQKDAAAVDAKLIEKYGIAVSESTRARRKRLGYANLQYIRHDRQFVILATKGRHDFFEEERTAIRDIRRVPLKYAGYSISYRREGQMPQGAQQPKWHAHVAIERERYLELKAHLLDLATHRSAEKLALAFYRLPYEPYAPVRRQMLNLLRAVNKARNQAGFSRIPTEVLPLRRRVVRPFDSHRDLGRSEEGTGVRRLASLETVDLAGRDSPVSMSDRPRPDRRLARQVKVEPLPAGQSSSDRRRREWTLTAVAH